MKLEERIEGQELNSRGIIDPFSRDAGKEALHGLDVPEVTISEGEADELARRVD